MSLSSFLLGKRHSKDKEIDGGLDALLRSPVCQLQNPALSGVLIGRLVSRYRLCIMSP